MQTFVEKVKSLQERKPTWFAGGTKSQCEELIDQLTQKAKNEGKHVWSIRHEDRTFQSYSFYAELLQFIFPIIQKENPDLIEQFRQTLKFVAPEFLNTVADVETPKTADAVTFAIIRRISRESLQTPEQIDFAARFFLEAKRNCPSLSGPIEVFIHNFEWLDRPSLRILYRIQVLSTQQDDLTWSIFLNRWPINNDFQVENNMGWRITQARQLILTRIFQDLEPKLVQIGEAGDVDFSESFQCENSQQNWIDTTAHLLVQMNYDRAYVVAATALRNTQDPVTRGEIYRLIGLIDANIGDYQSAQKAFANALELAESETLKAHLNYLIGLLYTKRFRDLDTAERYFTKGLAQLSSLSEDDPSVTLERAWLMNGQGFARSLRSKELPEQERTQALEAIVLHEISAYNLARKHNDGHFVYLRFNLLANIAFLLEILRKFGQASDFWQRAFQPYLDENQVNEFQMVYHYRQAMLLYRDGQHDRAFKHIADSLKLALHFHDRFLEERIKLGYGYIAYHTGKFDVAYAMHKDGLQLAWELRNWNAMVEHAIALAYASTQIGQTEILHDLGEIVTMLPGKHEVGKAFQRAIVTQDFLKEGLRMSMPSPKLPAYLPSIDLEMTPTWDINKYLVMTEAEQFEMTAKSE